MYTVPQYRRGIASQVLSRLMEEAREHGCKTVNITASDAEMLMYTAFGFVKNKNFMQYEL